MKGTYLIWSMFDYFARVLALNDRITLGSVPLPIIETQSVIIFSE